MILLAGLIASTSIAFAHGHEDSHMDGHAAHNPCSMQGMAGMDHHSDSMKPMLGMKKGTFLKKVVIDGYDVSFHIMKAPKGMEHGGSHHLMMKVEQNNKIIALKAVNSKVTHPNDKSESKMMMKMGDWYMAGYDLNHAGKHEIKVLFKTMDDQKHFGGVAYSSK